MHEMFDAELPAFDPDLFCCFHVLPHRQPTVCSADYDIWVIWAGNRSRIWLQPAIKEGVEGFVGFQIRLSQLRERIFELVCFDKREYVFLANGSDEHYVYQTLVHHSHMLQPLRQIICLAFRIAYAAGFGYTYSRVA